MARRKSTKTKKRFFIIFTLAGLFLAVAYTIYLDFTVRARFEGKRWALPARVYARPLELFPGLKLSASELAKELVLLSYRETPSPKEPGTYNWHKESLDLVTRPFVFGDGPQDAITVSVDFDNDRVRVLINSTGNDPLHLVRLDPPLIGGIYPSLNEDRVLVKLDEVPKHVIHALIAVEDHRFYSHFGIDPWGIARAIVTTASSGRVQGGSTLTQQLVKNFYLTSERSLRRKLTEIIMALLLEVHYDKQDILETYINEVYLGQNGNLAIHGFGLASQYYFNKPVSNLSLPDAALLVGMLKGPSYYNPRSKPKRVLERRDLVLKKMAEEGFITEQQLRLTKRAPLGVIDRSPGRTTLYPAFMDLVHRQLRRDYREEDLRSEGLQIFTTLDPQVQHSAESTLSKRLARLEKARGIEHKILQGALIVTSTQNAEVQAVVGGRDPRYEGFNRALDAQRPIGSLIKPFVFLTALQKPQRYTLATRLDDSPLVLQQAGIDDWAPQNYDKEFHGEVPLRLALANSYNVSTVRLGLELGISQVMANLKRFGMERDLPEYASSILGSNTVSLLEVTQIYQTVANGGFYAPLRAIREVLSVEGKPLQRYPLNVKQVMDGAPLYLLTTAMQDVITEGTARGLRNYLSSNLDIAGKTGTTNDFRDSWFAGITGDRLAVVWIGRDDNRPTGLTGASGAMTIWGEMMASLDPEPLILPEPENIERVWIDPISGLRSGKGCRNDIELPFIKGSAPVKIAPCGRRSSDNTIKGWFERAFQW